MTTLLLYAIAVTASLALAGLLWLAADLIFAGGADDE